MPEKPLWSPSRERVAGANLTRFIDALNQAYKLKLRDYHELWRWSVEHIEAFWDALWQYSGVIGDRGKRVLADAKKMPGARFFPYGNLNFAENLLVKDAKGDAIVFWGEDKVKRRLSHRELRETVSRLQQAFANAGVKEGDRVAAFMPNMPETVICMLAVTSLGAGWTPPREYVQPLVAETVFRIVTGYRVPDAAELEWRAGTRA